MLQELSKEDNHLITDTKPSNVLNLNMKKLFRTIIILIAPFIVMIMINEAIRPSIKDIPYIYNSVPCMNSAKHFDDKCSWVCHNSTKTCKSDHVKKLNNYFHITDKPYFSVIDSLKSTGNYAAANIIFLVILFPFTILFFLIKSWDIQDKISNYK